MNHNMPCTTTNPGDSCALESLRSMTLSDEFPEKGSEVLSMEVQVSLWTPENLCVACS